MKEKQKKLTEEEMKTFLIEQIKNLTGIAINIKTQCVFQNITKYNRKAQGELCIEKKIIVVCNNKIHELGLIHYDRFFDEQSSLYNEDIESDNKAIKNFLELCAKKVKDKKIIVPNLTNNYNYIVPASPYAT